MAELEKTLLTPLNKTKKKRVYYQLAKLKKALHDPSLIVDIDEKYEK